MSKWGDRQLPACLICIAVHSFSSSKFSYRAHERVLEASSLSVPALKEAVVAEGGYIAGLQSLAELLPVLSTLRAAEVYLPLPVPAVPEVVPVPNGPADPSDGGQPPAAELPPRPSPVNRIFKTRPSGWPSPVKPSTSWPGTSRTSPSHPSPSSRRL